MNSHIFPNMRTVHSESSRPPHDAFRNIAARAQSPHFDQMQAQQQQEPVAPNPVRTENSRFSHLLHGDPFARSTRNQNRDLRYTIRAPRQFVRTSVREHFAIQRARDLICI